MSDWESKGGSSWGDVGGDWGGRTEEKEGTCTCTKSARGHTVKDPHCPVHGEGWTYP